MFVVAQVTVARTAPILANRKFALLPFMETMMRMVGDRVDWTRSQIALLYIMFRVFGFTLSTSLQLGVRDGGKLSSWGGSW